MIARFDMPSWLTSSRYCAQPVGRPRGHRRGRARGRRGHGLDHDPRRQRQRRCLRAPRRREDRAAVSSSQRPTRACPRADAEPSGSPSRGDRRRPPPLLVADVHAGAHGIQAALLRLRARLPLDAGAPIAAVLGPVGLFHQDRPCQRLHKPRRTLLWRAAAWIDRAVYVLRRSHR